MYDWYKVSKITNESKPDAKNVEGREKCFLGPFHDISPFSFQAYCNEIGAKYDLLCYFNN